MEQTLSARKASPSDLRDGEWAILEPLVPAVKPGGRPARHSRRASVNAILYVVRGGNQWRAMPHDLPPWQTAYYYCRIWRNDGTWERLPTALRERTRRQLGREATPSAAILDSHSGTTGQRGAPAATTPTRGGAGASGSCWGTRRGSCSRGWSAPPRCRTAMARAGSPMLCRSPAPICPDLPRRSLVGADAGYSGQWVDDLRQPRGWTLAVVQRDATPPRGTCAVPAHRGIVERTFSGWGGLRRLSKDYA